jgi:hypothetical protein
MMGLEEEKELISFLVLIDTIPLFQSSNNPVRIFQYFSWEKPRSSISLVSILNEERREHSRAPHPNSHPPMLNPIPYPLITPMGTNFATFLLIPAL